MLHSDGEKLFEPYASWLLGEAGEPAAVSVREAICNEVTNRVSALDTVEFAFMELNPETGIVDMGVQLPPMELPNDVEIETAIWVM